MFSSFFFLNQPLSVKLQNLSVPLSLFVHKQIQNAVQLGQQSYSSVTVAEITAHHLRLVFVCLP